MSNKNFSIKKFSILGQGSEPLRDRKQRAANHYYRLCEAQSAIVTYLKEYRSLFPGEIQNFLLDIWMVVQEAQNEMG